VDDLAELPHPSQLVRRQGPALQSGEVGVELGSVGAGEDHVHILIGETEAVARCGKMSRSVLGWTAL
jgi:hypothetical protein